jgi:hypothetical protein
MSDPIQGPTANIHARMMGQDQDDLVLAPWTTIKYRITGSKLVNTNQSNSSGTSRSVNTISNLYPGDQPSLYPEKSTTQTTNNPMLVRFATVDAIMTAARSADEIPTAIEQITGVLRRRHGIGLGRRGNHLWLLPGMEGFTA